MMRIISWYACSSCVDELVDAFFSPVSLFSGFVLLFSGTRTSPPNFPTP